MPTEGRQSGGIANCYTSVVVRASDWQSKDCRFDFHRLHRRVTTLCKLFTCARASLTEQYNLVLAKPVMFCGREDNSAFGRN